MPTTTSPARKTPKLGDGSQTAMVSRARPASSAGIAAASSCCAGREAVSACASAAVANTANEMAPASACEGSWSVPARKLGASEVNSPKTENAVAAPRAAAKKRPRERAGTDTRCGRYFGRGDGRLRVSGAARSATHATTSAAVKTTNGTRSACPADCASRPEISPPTPRPPRLAAVAIICVRRLAAPRSSDSQAVAVAVTMPMPTPLTTLATSNPGSEGHTMNTTPARISSTSAGIKTRRRP